MSVEQLRLFFPHVIRFLGMNEIIAQRTQNQHLILKCWRRFLKITDAVLNLSKITKPVIALNGRRYTIYQYSNTPLMP
jgi:hypothetical protein